MEELEFFKKCIGLLQAQRNAANDAHAMAEARLSLASDKLSKANDRIKELESTIESSQKVNS